MPELNIGSLMEKAKNSADKESYFVLQRTRRYRIGAGARITPSDQSSFFLEAIVALTDESRTVNLLHLQGVLELLKMLRSKGYMLAYIDDNCISCETIKESQDLEREYLFLDSILRNLG